MDRGMAAQPCYEGAGGVGVAPRVYGLAYERKVLSLVDIEGRTAQLLFGSLGFSSISSTLSEVSMVATPVLCSAAKEGS